MLLLPTRNTCWMLQNAVRTPDANICCNAADESETLNMPTCRTLRACIAAFGMTWLVLCLALTTSAPANAEARKTAVFPFEYVDDSQANELFPKVPADEAARLKMIHDRLAELLAATGNYEPTDTAPAVDAIAMSATAAIAPRKSAAAWAPRSSSWPGCRRCPI
jgi:hypothetical protein